MFSLLDSTVLVLCSKSYRNRFEKFNPDRLKIGKWNEKSEKSKMALDRWLFTYLTNNNRADFINFRFCQ